MRKKLNNIIFILISILIVLLEKDRLEALSNAYQGETQNSSFYITLNLSLFISFIVGILINYRYASKGALARSLTIFTVYSYFVLIVQASFFSISSLVYFSFLLPSLSYFYFSSSTNQTSKGIIKLVIPLVFVSIGYFSIINQRSISILVSSEEAANTSYYFLACLPFMLLGKNKVIRVVSILVVLYAVVTSFKRGGLIALAFGVALYYFVLLRSSNSRHKMGLFLLSIIILALFALAFFQFNDLSGNILGERIINTSIDGGSERNLLYPLVIEKIRESSALQFLLGHGWDSVSRARIGYVSAHNDYLQLLYDLGAISLILYIAFLIKLFKKGLALIKNHSPLAPAFACSLGIFIVLSLVSHILLYSNLFLLFTAFWGIIDSQNESLSPPISII